MRSQQPQGGNGKINPGPMRDPARPSARPMLVLGRCYRPGQARLYFVIQSPRECQWQCSEGLPPDGPALWALCPLPCQHHQLPGCQQKAGLPGVASSTLCSARKLSSSLSPLTSRSQWPLFLGCQGPSGAVGKIPGAGWHRSLAVSRPTNLPAMQNRPAIVCERVFFFSWVSYGLIAI